MCLAGRSTMEHPPNTLTYGEIEFDSFQMAFSKIRRMYGLPGVGTTPPGGIMQAPGGKFYDIGSGTGKPCLAAACIHPFDSVHGIEVTYHLGTVVDIVALCYRAPLKHYASPHNNSGTPGSLRSVPSTCRGVPVEGSSPAARVQAHWGHRSLANQNRIHSRRCNKPFRDGLERRRRVLCQQHVL